MKGRIWGTCWDVWVGLMKEYVKMADSGTGGCARWRQMWAGVIGLCGQH